MKRVTPVWEMFPILVSRMRLIFRCHIPLRPPVQHQPILLKNMALLSRSRHHDYLTTETHTLAPQSSARLPLLRYHLHGANLEIRSRLRPRIAEFGSYEMAFLRSIGAGV